MRWLFSLFLIVLVSATLDLPITRLFFDGEKFPSSTFYDAVYNFGTFPGWVLAFSGLFALLTKKWRKEGLFLILVLAIGSGLIAHLVLKEGFPRPRPKQVLEFGGKVPFHPLYSPRMEDKGPFRSLPCGHATMGFYLLALIPIGRKWNNRALIWLGLFSGLLMGAILSFTRVAQGGHFFSDTLVSLWVMAGITFFLSPLLGTHERSHASAT